VYVVLRGWMIPVRGQTGSGLVGSTARAGKLTEGEAKQSKAFGVCVAIDLRDCFPLGRMNLPLTPYEPPVPPRLYLRTSP
jgi:hypothetical protein